MYLSKNKAFTLLELIFSVFVVSLLIIILLNYSNVQSDAFEFVETSTLLSEVVNNELPNVYSNSDWSNLTESKTVDSVIISYSNYRVANYNAGATSYSTEAITLTFKYKEEEWSYEIERAL